jgi:hypothetical protein
VHYGYSRREQNEGIEFVEMFTIVSIETSEWRLSNGVTN